MRALDLGLLSLSLLTACGTPTHYDATEVAPLVLTEPTVVPLDPELIPPLVHVTLDGREGLVFLLDSGATVTSLDPDVARELGLETRPYASASSSEGSDGEGVAFDSYVPVDRLQVGALRIERLRLPLIENAAGSHFGWAGILGQDVLARVPVVLDSERSAAHLLPPDAGLEGIQAYLRDAQLGDGKWAVLPCEYRPRPFFPLAVTGEPAGRHEMLIDSGATRTSLAQPVIDALALEQVGTYRARSIGGEYGGLTYHLEELDLFGIRISTEVQDTPLDYSLLGMNVLGELVVVLDGPGDKVWLHRRAAPAEAEAEVEAEAPDDATGR